MKTKFISRYGKLAGNSPTTGAAPNMKALPPSGADGTTTQAMNQIRNAPRPFGNPRLNPISTAPPVNRNVRNLHGLPSARGTRPANPATAASRSAPMSDSQILRGAGYTKPVNYAGNAVHVQKDKSIRVMRNKIPGARPLVDNSDVFSAESIRNWNKSARGL